MNQKNYQVTIHTEHCVDELAVVARRLAALSEQSEGVLLDSLLMGLLVFRNHLSYEDAAACKEMLAREGISAQVSRSAADVREPEAAQKEAAGGWEALFPELTQNESTEKSIKSVKREEKSQKPPKISSWQPAMDTEEGVVASVSVAGILGADKTEKSRVFAGDVLTGAIASQEEARGPYAPTGFDPRPAHVPLVAALFSGFAPGAGQVYNGQDARALKYSLQFWWIRPWIASVRQAHEFGVRIRDYQEPRPEEAAFGRAVRYAAGWYLSVIVVAVVVGFMMSAVFDRTNVQGSAAVPVEIADVTERAVHGVQFARVAANTAVNKFLDEQNKLKQEFTMSAEERAHRLYVIGYSYCAARQYTLCEVTMRRVTGLGAKNRDAYRLQTWASMQLKSGEKSPMPEVGEVPTLFEFELHQENDPDRDILQPALDSLLAGTAENKADEVDEAKKIDQ